MPEVLGLCQWKRLCDADFLQVLQARNSLTPRYLASWSALIPDQQAAQVTAEAQC